MADVDRIQQKLRVLPTSTNAKSKRQRMQMWREVDFNGNGILSLAEVDHALVNTWGVDPPKNVTNRAFHAARDMAKPVADFSDDYIDFAEFRIFLVYLQHYYELFKAYMELDANGDGRLSANEFVQIAPILRDWGVQGFEDPMLAFQKADADGGGMIMFDEFAHWALQQGVGALAEDQEDRKDAIEILKQAKANLASKDFDDMAHARFNVIEGVHGQGVFSKADAGHQLLTAALSVGSEVLAVNVHQAHNLRIADRTTSDPYVVVKFSGVEKQTKAIKRNLNPIWGETLRFPSGSGGLEINVWDYDLISSDDLLGKATLSEQMLRSGSTARMKLKLTGHPKAQGDIDISLRWETCRR